MKSITLRDAVSGDADTLSSIAFAAKKHWGYSDDLLELWKPDLTFTEEIIKARTLIVAEKDETAVGFAGLIFDSLVAELSDLWVIPEHMGLGIGRKLLESARNLTQERGISKLKIVSDPQAASFYLHVGAMQTGWQQSKPEGRELPVFSMKS